MFEKVRGYVGQMTSIGMEDLPMIGALSAVYFIYRVAVSRLVIGPFGRLCGVKDVTKFGHRTFDLIHYTAVSLVGIAAFMQRPYFVCLFYAKNCRDMFRQNPNGFEISVLEKIYYIQMVIYYIVDIFYLTTGSQPLMFAMHHAASLSMAAGCVVRKSPAVGLSVMLLHDISDVPLYFAKVMGYLGFEIPKVMGLGAFFVGFTWLRMVNLLFILYNSVWIVMGGNVEGPKLYTTMIVLLCVLYSMHIMWYYKILKIVARSVKGKGTTDSRSDGQ